MANFTNKLQTRYSVYYSQLLWCQLNFLQFTILVSLSYYLFGQSMFTMHGCPGDICCAPVDKVGTKLFTTNANTDILEQNRDMIYHMKKKGSIYASWGVKGSDIFKGQVVFLWISAPSHTLCQTLSWKFPVQHVLVSVWLCRLMV